MSFDNRYPSHRELDVIARQPSLASLRQVTALNIGNGPAPREPWQVDWLDQFPRVRRLTLAGARVPPVQFEALQELEVVHMVDGFEKNRETGLALAKLPKLKELFCARYPGDDFFEGLAGSKSLQFLHLWPARFASGNAAKFFRALAPLKSLRVLGLDGEWGLRLNDDDLSALCQLKHLQMIRLIEGHLGTPEQPLTKLSELKNLERLNVLMLENVARHPDWLEHVGRMPNLRMLFVGVPKSENLGHLTPSKRLEALHIEGNIRFDDLVSIVAMPSMRQLDVEYTLDPASWKRLLDIARERGTACQVTATASRALLGDEPTRTWWRSINHRWGYGALYYHYYELFERYLDPPLTDVRGSD